MVNRRLVEEAPKTEKSREKRFVQQNIGGQSISRLDLTDLVNIFIKHISILTSYFEWESNFLKQIRNTSKEWMQPIWNALQPRL